MLKIDELNDKLDAERRLIFDNLVDLQFYLRSEFDQVKRRHQMLSDDMKFSLLSQNAAQRIK